jgi:hypothetical protein
MLAYPRIHVHVQDRSGNRAKELENQAGVAIGGEAPDLRATTEVLQYILKPTHNATISNTFGGRQDGHRQGTLPWHVVDKVDGHAPR